MAVIQGVVLRHVSAGTELNFVLDELRAQAARWGEALDQVMNKRWYGNW